MPANVDDEVTIDEVEVRFNGAALSRLALSGALSSTEMRIVLWLATNMDQSGHVRCTRAALARTFGVTPHYISKTTTKLRNLGLAWREPGRKIRVSPEFAFRGESRDDWQQALNVLDEGAPPLAIPDYQVAPPRAGSGSSERHLKAI